MSLSPSKVVDSTIMTAPAGTLCATWRPSSRNKAIVGLLIRYLSRAIENPRESHFVNRRECDSANRQQSHAHRVPINYFLNKRRNRRVNGVVQRGNGQLGRAPSRKSSRYFLEAVRRFVFQ